MNPVILLALAPARADCGPGFVTTSPDPGGRLEGQLVLVDFVTDPLERLDLDDGDLALVWRDERVELRVVEVLRGTLNVTQWVLEPEAPLQGRRRWTLEVDQGARRGPLHVSHRGERGPAVFTSRKAPAEPAVWRGRPRVTQSERLHFGCGPSVSVVVDVPVEGAAWIEATVRPAAGGEAGSTRLELADGQIVLGHGMCGGNLELEPGVEYLADLVAIDAVGRRTPAGDPLRFTAP